MRIKLSLVVEALKSQPIENWIQTVQTLGDSLGLSQEERTRAMMIADGRTDEEIESLIVEIKNEEVIESIIKKVTNLATTGSAEEISKNLHRLALLAIRIREGSDYVESFKELYPELN